MDYEEQSRLLAPSPEHLASVKGIVRTSIYDMG